MSEISKTVGSKRIYRALLFILKYVPMILAIANIIALILQFFGISFVLLNCTFGTSILFLVVLYMLSYVFRFCYLYRLPLHYVTTINLLQLIDAFIGIPISTTTIFSIYLIITGLAIVIYVYKAFKNRNVPKTKTNVFKIYRWFGCMQLPTNNG